MIRKSIAYILIFFYFTTQNFAQNIRGIVFSDDRKVSNAQIIVKKQNRIIAYTLSDSNGEFIFRNIVDDSLQIHASHLNYRTNSIYLSKVSADLLKIELVERDNALDEVVIKQSSSIYQKKDTVVYSVSAFRNGSERVVEDLLKKLPGITISDAGRISFKGKEIQSLMIDGDDLFNTNYTIGSKNLDINDVEAVEAIENFNKNKILHKISDSDQVAINLKLKKGIPLLSSRAALENDFYDKFNNTVTGLLLHSKYKGFSELAINNIGKVSTTDLSFAGESISDKFKTNDIISSGVFPQFIGTNQSLLNTTFRSNNSTKFNISKQLALTFMANYNSDRLWQKSFNETLYSIEDSTFVLTNSDQQTRRTPVISVSNQLEYYNKKDIQLTSTVLFINRQSDYENFAINNGDFRQSNVNTNVSYLGVKSEFSKLISANSAFHLLSAVSRNTSMQEFSISPSTDIIPYLLTDQQLSAIETDLITFNGRYYKNWKNIKFSVINNLESRTDDMLSHLNSGNNPSNEFKNDIIFKSLSNHLATQLSYSSGRLRFTFENGISYNQAKRANDKFDEINLLFRYESKYTLTKKQSFQFIVSRSVETPELVNIFKNPILTSYRSTSFNQGDLGNIRKTDYSLNYIISDLYNTFYLRAAINHTNRNKDYFNKFVITPELISTEAILLSLNNTTSTFNLTVHKLIPFIKINLKYEGNYILASTYNFLDNLSLRSVTAKTISNEVLLSTKLRSNVDVSNKFTINSTIFKADDRQNNFLNQLKNELTVNCKVFSRISINSFLQTYIPNNKIQSKYNFFGLEFSTTFNKPNCELYIRGQNLFNHKTFNNITVTDFAISSFSYRLQERNILLGIRFKIF